MSGCTASTWDTDRADIPPHITHRIYADILLRQHLGEATDEILGGAFGGCIGEQDRVWHVGIDRRGVDDRAPGCI